MKIRKLITHCFISLPVLLLSQSNISNVYSPAGGSDTRNGLKVFWTFGQASLIEHANSGEGTGCRQGFIQPHITRKTKQASQELLRISLTPNPADNVLLFQNLSQQIEPVDVKLFTITGRSVFEKKGIHSASEEIDVSLLNDGYYLMEINQDDVSDVFKVIILHK